VLKLLVVAKVYHVQVCLVIRSSLNQLCTKGLFDCGSEVSGPVHSMCLACVLVRRQRRSGGPSSSYTNMPVEVDFFVKEVDSPTNRSKHIGKTTFPVQSISAYLVCESTGHVLERYLTDDNDLETVH
jgi:hypothetical protein